MKKLISLILALSMTVLCFPSVSSAASYGENMALGKKMIASGGWGYGYDLEHINDGNPGSTAALGSNVEADGMKEGFNGAYIGVDLGEKYDLTAVVVRTRRDMKDDWCRLIGGVYVANKEDFSDNVLIGKKTVAGDYGSDLEIEFDEPVTARYVFISGGAGAYGELEVYGKKYVPIVEGVYSDVPENCEKAVRIVSKLGIMGGIKNGVFGTDVIVTRAEAAAVANALVKGTSVEYKGEFADVSADHEYAGDIASALALGLISKDYKFRPDDYVTSYELFAMLMRASGFYAMSEEGAWYNDVLRLASYYGLSEGIDTSTGYINRGDVAMAVYNVLMGKYIEVSMGGTHYEMSEDTFMKKKFDVEYAEGIVTANAVTSLTAEKFSGDGYIQIGNAGYFMEDVSKTDGLLGKSVCYLVNDDDEEVIDVWENSKKNKTVEIKSADIDSTSQSSIRTATGTKKNYKLDTNAYYLKNGVAYAGVKYDALAPKYGSVRLIDNDDDNTYEIVEIREPSIIAVGSVAYDEEKQEIILTGKENFKKTIQYDAVAVYESNGARSELSSLKTAGLVYMYLSNSGKYVEFEVQNGKASGVVSQLTEEAVVIDSTEYKLSEYFKDKYYSDVKGGGTYTFLLNNYGEIVCTAEESAFVKPEQLVVITKCHEVTDEDKVRFKVFAQDGKFYDLDTALKCKVDGVMFTTATFANMGKAYFVGQPAIIKTNANNEVITMTTPASERLKKRTENIYGCYTGTAGFFSGGSLVMPTCHDTVSFRIPVDSLENPKTEDNFTVNYSVTTLDKRYQKARNTITENVRFYGSGEDDLPLVAITQIPYGDVSGYGVIVDLENWNTIVVNKVSEMVDNDGYTQYKITGWDLRSGAEKTFTTDTSLTSVVNTFKAKHFNLYDAASVPDEFKPASGWFRDTYLWNSNTVNSYFLDPISSIKKGDVIRYGFVNGNSYAEQLEVVIKYDKLDEVTTSIPYSGGDLPGTIFSSYRLQKATITKCTDGRVLITLPDGTTENLALEDFSGVLLAFDGKYAEKHSMSEAEGYIGAGERALIFSTAGIHQSIIVMN